METFVALPITLKGEHWTITTISLNAFTDDIDTPVHKSEFHLFRGRVAESMVGNLFFLENMHDGDAYVIMTDCPDYGKANLMIRNYTVTMDAGTNTVTVISCKKASVRRFAARNIVKIWLKIR